MDFDEAFDALLGHEGGYANDPRDPGGETYKGVARRFNPSWPGWERIDAAKLRPGFPKSLDADTVLGGMARELYRTKYWGPAGCDAVPGAIKFDLFDMAVNAGVKPAIRTLQTAVFADVDGLLGPRTLMAVQSMDPMRLRARFNGLRLTDYTESGNWNTYGKGWALRIANNLLKP